MVDDSEKIFLLAVGKLQASHAKTEGSREQVRRSVEPRALTPAQQVAQRKRQALSCGFPDERTVLLPAIADAPWKTPAIRSLWTILRWHESESRSGTSRGVFATLKSGPGGGKTVAMGCVAARYPGTCCYLSSDRLNELIEGNVQEYAERFARWRSVKLLLIDDLGSEAGTRAATRFAALALPRYRDGLVTICSTNISDETFIRSYFSTEDAGTLKRDARMVSRLDQQLQDGLPWWWDLRTPDYRSRPLGARLY